VSRPLVGVLALQGDVPEHLAALRATGVDAIGVRTADELARIDGLVLPGGESTTISRLARIFGLLDPLRERVAGGLPTFGSCAGMILLADRVLDGRADQETIGGMDVTVRRNAFGRQVASFETDLEVSGIDGGPMHAVFIRAPWIEQAGAAVEVLATVGEGPAAGRIVAARQGHLLASSFHPELTSDERLHHFFVDMVRGQR
jgi:5'-phosphate synthase pdxT subunit